MVHLHTPAAPRVAACGDPSARRFTAWRWQATCPTCKMVTAPRQLDAMQPASIADARFRSDLPIRYSALVAFVRKHAPLPNVEQAIAEFERERQTAAVCTKHGPLADPIALMDVVANRMMFACPECSAPDVKARWEASS